MKANTMKKLLSATLVSAMGVSMLAGCAGTAPAATTDSSAAATEETTEAAPAAADEEVTITLGIWPEDTLEGDIAMHEGFVETMKALHPNVTCVPAYYKYSTDTFMPMVESGNCPTVFESWFTEPQKLIKAGAVADITDELEARGWVMSPAIKELLSDENGRVYGIPRDGYALGLMCNKELFREAGLVNEDGTIQYPKTWDELAEDAVKIKDATGSAGLCLLAKDNAGGWHFSNIAWAFGATGDNALTIDNGDGTFTANLDSDAAIAAMQFVKDLKWEYDVLTADPTNEDWGTGFTELGTGSAAMYIAANDAVNQPTQVNGLPVEDLALVPIPAADGGQWSLFGGTPYMFSKDATEAEINAALDYIEIMGKSPEVTDESLAGLDADYANKASEGVPVIKRFPCWVSDEYVEAENSVIEKYQNVDPADYAAYFAATEAEGLHSEEPGMTQDMYAELTKVLQEVITNQDADVAALMKTADENYQSILDAQ